MHVTHTNPDSTLGGVVMPMVPHLARSLVAAIVGSLVLRIAAQTTGQMTQFYFNTIDRDYFIVSYTQSGLITSSFFAAELIGSPLLGALSDRYGRRVFLIIGPLLGAVAVQITSLSFALWLLLLARVLEGLSAASSIPATLSYISEATSGRPRLRAKVMGIFEISFTGGIALGGLLGGYLWDLIGKPVDFLGLHITPAFSANSLMYLASLAIFFWGVRDIRGAVNKRAGVAEHLKALKSPGVWRFAPAWLAVNSIFGMWNNHSVRLLTGNDRFAGQLLTGNYGPKQFGVGQALFAVIFLIGIFAWSFSIGRYRKTNVMLCGIAGMFATLAVVYSLNHLNSLPDSAFYPLMAAFAIGILIMSGFAPAALVYLAGLTEAHSTDRGSIMGLYSVFLGVGQLIGTAVGGRFATWNGIDGLLLLSAILGVITTVTVVVLRRQESSASFKPDSSAAVET